MNGYSDPRHPPPRPSLDGEFDQFKEGATYGDSVSEDLAPPRPIVNGESGSSPPRARPPPHPRGPSDFDLRNRELVLRERELQLREREIEIQRRQGRIRHNVPSTIMDDEEDEDDTRSTSQRPPMVGGGNFDMMSVTGRRARKQQANVALRGKQPFAGGDPNIGGGSGRLMSLGGRNKGRSQSSMSVSQAAFDPLNENPLMGFTSNRYPGVDTRTLTANSRANSFTSQRIDELGMGPGRTASLLGGGAYPTMSRGPPPARGGSMMSGNGPSGRGRPPPQGGADFGGPTPSRLGYHDPSVFAPVVPPKDPAKVRSTTGSASASSASLGGNGESHSSSSSLEPPLQHNGRF